MASLLTVDRLALATSTHPWSGSGGAYNSDQVLDTVLHCGYNELGKQQIAADKGVLIDIPIYDTGTGQSRSYAEQ